MNGTIPVVEPAACSRRLGGFLRDLAAGMRQEMFFLGKDVSHPAGNLLLGGGLEKMPGGRVGGTSRYQGEWEGGRIQMHGSYAGWAPKDGGCGLFYFRPAGRWVKWDGRGLPESGAWEGMKGIEAVSEDLWDLARRWIRWWLAWEKGVIAEYGWKYRMNCYRHFRRLPRSKAWLEPAPAVDWLERLEKDWRSAERSRKFVFRQPRA